MTEFKKRLLLSLAPLPITGVVGWVLQHALSYWGILDPLAESLGDWLKVNFGTSIDLPGMLWGIALLLSFSLYAGALFLIWKMNKSHSSASPPALGISEAAPNRGAASPSSQVPAPRPSTMPIKGDHVYLGALSAAAETKRRAPTSMAVSESPITTEPKATASYPCLDGLDLSILYTIDKEKGTVLLKFLPDGENVPQKAIELILFGNKLLLGLDRTPIGVADYAIQKSNLPLSFSHFYYDVNLGTLRSHRPAEFAAGDGIGSRIIREGLAKGRSLRLRPDLHESTAEMAADLILRA
jgi:hypothetical protein